MITSCESLKSGLKSRDYGYEDVVGSVEKWGCTTTGLLSEMVTV